MQGVNRAKGSLGWNQGVICGNTSIELQSEIPQNVTFCLVLSVLKHTCRNIEREGEERDLEGFI